MLSYRYLLFRSPVISIIFVGDDVVSFENLSEIEQQARSRIILPLDNLNTYGAALGRITALAGYTGMFKIGKGSHTRLNNYDLVNAVKNSGANFFLDLKYKDIPNTVEDASKAATEHGAKMFNVHADGGYDMMVASMNGIDQAIEENPDLTVPKGLAVTVLTSLGLPAYLFTQGDLLQGELREYDFISHIDLTKRAKELKVASKKNPMALPEFTKVSLELKERDNVLYNMVLESGYVPSDTPIEKVGEVLIGQAVAHRTRMAIAAGMDGIVCSAADLKYFNEIGFELPKDFVTVTPGIKHPSAAGFVGTDQARVMIPSVAIEEGADYLVIGRAITGGKTPEERQHRAYEVIEDIARVIV